MKLGQLNFVLFLLMPVLIGCSSLQGIRSTKTSNTDNASPPVPASNDKIITPIRTILPTANQELLETPLPTLSVEQSTKFIKELLLNNGGCKLPCFWGIIPGTTEWNSAKVFLKTFAEIREGKYYSIKIQDPEYHRVNLIEFKVEEGIIIEIVAGPPVTRNFTVDRILIEHGKPEEIYLLTYRNAPTSPTPAFLVLNYQHQGILAEYEFASEKISDTEFLICSQAIGPSMWLRSSQKTLTELEINQSVLGPEPSYTLRKIGEVSDISVEEFYNEFKGSLACFKTPINIWP